MCSMRNGCKKLMTNSTTVRLAIGNRSTAAQHTFVRRKTYPVLSVWMKRVGPSRAGGSTRISVRATRALTGPSLSVRSTDIFEPFVRDDLQYPITRHGIFNTGRPVSFLATVGPFVSVIGEGAYGRGRLGHFFYPDCPL